MLTFNPDDFINERFESHPRWVVTLSDGRKVYQDDDRPGVTPNSAWIRLGIFLEKNPDLSIVDMTIGFRSHIVDVGKNAKGYFFSKSLMASAGTNEVMGFFVVGTLSEYGLRIKKYLVPEIEQVEEEVRYPLEGESLICQKDVLKNLNISLLPPPYTVQTLSILPN